MISSEWVDECMYTGRFVDRVSLSDVSLGLKDGTSRRDLVETYQKMMCASEDNSSVPAITK